MSSASALPQTLKSITATKIKELSKQRALFEKRRDEITKSANGAPDIRTKARILLEGVTRLKGHPNDALDKDDDDVESDDPEGAADSDEDSNGERAGNRNIRRFLLQSRYDPSVTRSVLEDWIARLERELEFLRVKHEHATFYSDLVTEWLSNLDGAEEEESKEEKSGASGSGFEEVGRKEMHEQRATWESLVFTTADMNPDDVGRYLESLFTGTKLSRQALEDLREKVKSFGTELMTRRKPFSVDTLKWVTNALLKSDLLTTEKAAILKEFLRNKEVAQEVADVLNMRLASLDSWNWGSKGIPMEMRRQLNGKYRVFMDPDLLDSLFHQYIGVEWCVAFRSAFHAFFCTRAWKSFSRPIPKRDRERRQYFLNEQRPQGGLDDYRKHVYQRDYFLSQLPTSVDEGVRSYDDEEGHDEGNAAKNPIETKHSLLHLLITESIIHMTLRGEFTVIRSDFKWFGPSLPHATILAVLKFFGVQKEWLGFFRVFLEAPVKFVQDGPDAAPQVRKRGIPMSYALSTCFGEAVLFCMDYAVNQHVDGAFLYRLHDDFWFWGEEKTCVKAWKAMSEFAQVMGIGFNEEKTGTVRLGEKNDGARDEESDPLPKGQIRWGFLKLDSKEGAFVIDQEQVDAHIEELRRQLSACKSVFAWVQAWNSYFARFFTNNFARPAMCFGRRHIDMVASTLSRIVHELFPTSTANNGGSTAPASSFSGSVTDYLRNVIAERFNVHDLPDGFFYFPVELGGLELRNPFIPFLAMREDIKQSPKRTLQKAFLEEEDKYHAAKERFEKDGSSLPKPDDDDAATTFFSFEEYTRYLEVHSRPLLDAYRYLIRVPGEISISKTPEFQSSQAWLDENIDRTGSPGVISSKWQKMSPYWKWVAELYHAGMLRKYGGLAAVDREFMPLGVVKVLREGKVRWQG